MKKTIKNTESKVKYTLSVDGCTVRIQFHGMPETWRGQLRLGEFEGVAFYSINCPSLGYGINNILYLPGESRSQDKDTPTYTFGTKKEASTYFRKVDKGLRSLNPVCLPRPWGHLVKIEPKHLRVGCRCIPWAAVAELVEDAINQGRAFGAVKLVWDDFYIPLTVDGFDD